MMDPGYYYSREGQQFGPVPGEQLKQLAAAGKLQPDDLVWKEGMANWVQASRVKGLFSTAAPQPPELTVAPLAPPPVGNTDARSNPPPAAHQRPMRAMGHGWPVRQRRPRWRPAAMP